MHLATELGDCILDDDILTIYFIDNDDDFLHVWLFLLLNVTLKVMTVIVSLMTNTGLNHFAALIRTQRIAVLKFFWMLPKGAVPRPYGVLNAIFEPLKGIMDCGRSARKRGMGE